MGKLKLRGKDLISIGYPQGPVISAAINTMTEHYPTYNQNEILKILGQVLQHPVSYRSHKTLGPIATFLIPKAKDESEVYLNNTGVPVAVYGKEFIEAGALDQINTAARLPVSVRAALMPDAHQGYGLPIGGVLATEGAVIPYGVGVDIGCRMCLSVFAIKPEELVENEVHYAAAIDQNTLFGAGKDFKKPTGHEVLERNEFRELGILRSLQATAAAQIGSSGSGNHFVEFGSVEIRERDEVLGLEPGRYLGLLSHSGSRALGAHVANYFTKLAKEKRKLQPSAANLAWLDLNEQPGVEYWMAMNLAGDYASACHYVIHEKIARFLQARPLKRVENHHNFAWKEVHDGKEVIVHRKGATPAQKDVLGIIPGSMSTAGFMVKGKGAGSSLASAAHGAGRLMSRNQALKQITHQAVQEMLQRQGIRLMGGGLDEAPFAYKDIYQVMQAQQDLITIVGVFHPKIVKMDGSTPKQWKRKISDSSD